MIISNSTSVIWMFLVKKSIWKVSTWQSLYRNSILVYIYFTNSRINQSIDGMQLDVFKNISAMAFYSLYQKRACWEEDRAGSGWPARQNLSKCQIDQMNTNLVVHFTENNSKRISFLWDRDFCCLLQHIGSKQTGCPQSWESGEFKVKNSDAKRHTIPRPCSDSSQLLWS